MFFQRTSLLILLIVTLAANVQSQYYSVTNSRELIASSEGFGITKLLKADEWLLLEDCGSSFSIYKRSDGYDWGIRSPATRAKDQIEISLSRNRAKPKNKPLTLTKDDFRGKGRPLLVFKCPENVCGCNFPLPARALLMEQPCLFPPPTRVYSSDFSVTTSVNLTRAPSTEAILSFIFDSSAAEDLLNRESTVTLVYTFSAIKKQVNVCAISSGQLCAEGQLVLPDLRIRELQEAEKANNWNVLEGLQYDDNRRLLMWGAPLNPVPRELER